MMGAGRSVVGRILAGRLGVEFIDSDRALERRSGLSVRKLFAERGERGFRELEREAIDELAGRPVVAALGGGAMSQPGMPERLCSSGTVVYLRARPETLLERVGRADARPLLRGLSQAQREEKLRGLLAERAAAYERAHVVVDTDELGLEGAASAVAQALGDRR